MHYGHQRGIIHRDLKPGNILVDSEGRVRVIDFGVARAVDADQEQADHQTQVGQIIGTAQYMSPEQFEADPNDLDTRSDVYALGVVLYELLAGRLPYHVEHSGIFEIARIVREEEPTALSRALPGVGEEIEAIDGQGPAEGPGIPLPVGLRLGGGHPALPERRGHLGQAHQPGLPGQGVRAQEQGRRGPGLGRRRFC